MRNTGIRSLNIIIIWYERPLYNTRHGGQPGPPKSLLHILHDVMAHIIHIIPRIFWSFFPPEYNRVLSAPEYLITIDNKCGKSRSCEGMEPAASDTIHLSQLQLGIITLLQQPATTDKNPVSCWKWGKEKGAKRSLIVTWIFNTSPAPAASRTNIVAVFGVESILSLIRRQSLMTFPLVWKYISYLEIVELFLFQ